MSYFYIIYIYIYYIWLFCDDIISHIWWCTHALKLVCATTVASFPSSLEREKSPAATMGGHEKALRELLGGVAVEIVLGSSTYHMRLGELFRSSFLELKILHIENGCLIILFCSLSSFIVCLIIALILLNTVVSFIPYMTTVIQPYDERRYIKHT